ncbi:hypothetical protein TKWG_12800 [Advenella kashmirensis WT001]|uniref:Uncharacterized protein n=1 Tax=Advenella kashmirensis (strain DSM 17095 / LMG 22695 / WT001) TaxID=1036672 RepID=I3UCG0_ADVKW|nr:hypothetical protein TKWG_12800 [Advenella kashmirensis WT001]
MPQAEDAAVAPYEIDRHGYDGIAKHLADKRERIVADMQRATGCGPLRTQQSRQKHTDYHGA